MMESVKLFDTLMAFLKEFFEKNQQTTKKHAKLPRIQRVNSLIFVYNFCSYLSGGINAHMVAFK